MSATERRRNILIGPGRVFRAPVGEPMPDETTVPYRGVALSPSTAGWGGNWEDIGLLMTGSGVVMRHSATYKEIKADGFLMPFDRVPTARQLAFGFSLLEYTPENLQLVFPGSTLTETAAGPGQDAFKALDITAEQDNDPYALGIEAFRKDAAGNKQPVRWMAYCVSIEPDGETPFNQDNEAMLPVVAQALHEDSVGKVALLHYVTAEMTP